MRLHPLVALLTLTLTGSRLLVPNRAGAVSIAPARFAVGMTRSIVNATQRGGLRDFDGCTHDADATLPGFTGPAEQAHIFPAGLVILALAHVARQNAERSRAA